MPAIDRRNLLVASAAGVVGAAASSVGAAERAVPPACDLPAQRIPNKLAWALVGPQAASAKGFQDFVIRDLALSAAKLVDGARKVTVTLQQPGEWSNASVDIGGTERRVDAVLEIVPGAPWVPVARVNEFLRESCANVQGWRLHATTIFDAFEPVPLGAPARHPHSMVFITRFDGTSPDELDRNWYIHAGHLDGQEAENEAAKQRRAAREKAGGGRRYIQNRVCEPITPTAWLVHGYTEFVSPAPPYYMDGKGALGGMGPRHQRSNGEKPFEEWPPLIVQGYEYRLL